MMEKPCRDFYDEGPEGFGEYRKAYYKWYNAENREHQHTQLHRLRTTPGNNAYYRSNFSPEHWELYVEKIFTQAKANAKKSGVEFTITLEYLKSLYRPLCNFTNITFTGGRDGRRQPFAPSIDRIDPNRGYIEGNIRIVCWAVNAGMQDFSDETYITVSNAVSANHPVEATETGTESSDK